MDFQTSELKTAIGKLKPIINTHSPLAAAKGILYKDGYLHATDANIYAAVKISTGLIPEDVQFIIPSTALDVAQKLPHTSTQINLVDNYAIEIVSGSYRAIFASISPTEFPAFESAGDITSSVQLESEDFIKAVSSVLYAVSKAQSKGVLCGINVKSNDEGQLELTGLDGFRLAQKVISANDLTSPFSAVVTREFCQAFTKLVGSSERFVLNNTNKCVTVQGDEFILKARKLAGDYVDSKTLLSRVQTDKVIRMDRDVLLQTLDLHSLSVKSQLGANNLVKVMVKDKDTVEFASNSASVQFSYTVPASCEGFEDGFCIGFNATYLQDSVKTHADAENIQLGMHSAITGVLVHNSEDTESGVALVLPVKLNS